MTDTTKNAPAFASFGSSVYEGETFEVVDDATGVTYRATIYRDDDQPAPWKASDGHGEVTSRTSRDKRPGERLLSDNGDGKRYYDFAGAVKTARRDGWGINPDALAALAARLGRDPTPGELAVAAVESDMEYLAGWLDDSWCWVGVGVQAIDDDGRELTTEFDFAIWGIESSSGDHLRDLANEYLSDCQAKVAAIITPAPSESDLKAAAYDATMRQFKAYDDAMNAAERAPTGEDYNRLWALMETPESAASVDSVETIPDVFTFEAKGDRTIIYAEADDVSTTFVIVEFGDESIEVHQARVAAIVEALNRTEAQCRK